MAGCVGLSKDRGERRDLRVRYGSANALAAANKGSRIVKNVRTGDSGSERVTLLMCSYLGRLVSFQA